MTYALVTSHAGHTVGGGARGSGYEESVVARQFNDLLIKAFKSVGQSVIDTTDNIGKTQSQNLANLVRSCNAHPKNGRLDISLHLNAGGGTGVEVFYYDQKELANNIAKAISDVTGLRNRGGKVNKGLYVLARTNAPAILIELGFIDNASDMSILMNKMQEVVNAIVRVVTSKEVQVKSKTKVIETGGLNPQAIKDVSEYFLSHGWWANIRFRDGMATAETGGLRDEALEDFKKWMDNRGWWYQEKEV
ncbi:N-acetylmuramoyl-L-alanine amidase [Priestia taiwanensis]|uniref:N-acetylmuramoyl-L-alanine amidase n=1 Tax=Priestia taiwanensis TaxID=1347902 RepID=A0A917APJ5_9BACI|nr:N-acetylmuramoyl-L-alanine amidase [Priestia taiwanensis]MBM7362698.1 N-acetylmuramoyl-L-alanine amidase [Priestia taiwanensis]GGE64353.1 N-acetylmuramoyl-L-alanine amidase [Priestia taiwanensis]